MAIDFVNCVSQFSVLESNSEFANSYFETIFVPLCEFCDNQNTLLTETILEFFPSDSFAILNNENQILATNLFFNLVNKGVTASSILNKFGQLDATNENLINFASHLIENVEDQNNIQKLTLFAEFMKSMNKDSIEFIGFLHSFYKIVNEKGYTILKKIAYPLSVLLQVHKSIIVSLI